MRTVLVVDTNTDLWDLICEAFEDISDVQVLCTASGRQASHVVRDLKVDLVIASVTTSIGMMQLPPVVISTPLKILLFVMVDGWNLLADQLIKSF